jgi:hypothetical protein
MKMKKKIISVLLLCSWTLLVSLITIKAFYWRIVATQKHFDAPLGLALEVHHLRDFQKISLQDKKLFHNSAIEIRLTEVAFQYCYWDELSFPRWFVYDVLKVKGEIEKEKIPRLLKDAAEYRRQHPITNDYFIPINWDTDRGFSKDEYLQKLGDYPEMLKSCWAKIEKNAK